MACFSDLPSAGVVWGVGLLGFAGVCFGSGMSFLRLHITYVMNVTSLIFFG